MKPADKALRLAGDALTEKMAAPTSGERGRSTDRGTHKI